MKKVIISMFLILVSMSVHATPLPANKVFHISAHKFDPNTFTVKWQIKKGYFLYKDRFSVTAPSDSVVQLANIRYPKALIHKDKLNNTFLIYRDNVMLSVPVLGVHPGEVLVQIGYQGCADDGFCYPPEKRMVKLSINDKLELVDASLEALPERIKPVKKDSSIAPSLPDEYESIFDGQSWPVIMLTFLGLGLLLSFTPCVLPMVPVLSGMIIGHGPDLTTRKAFFLSLSYVLSMALTYAVVGAVVAMAGANLQIMMQSSIAISIFSLIFILLALSMFDFYDLKLPVSWQAWLAGISRNQNHGHYFGAVVMGCLSTLILSPCITAPMIGALSFIAQSGDVFKGSMSLFFMGLGMGLPLLLIGTSAGKLLPKAGSWMNAVKHFFGVMLIAVALYLLGRILPGTITMILWAALLVFVGLFCGAFKPGQSTMQRFGQGLGLMALLYGLLILVGASMGSTNPLQPLSELKIGPHSQQPGSKVVVKSLSELQEALYGAKGKPVVLDFYADWCSSCQVIEHTTLKNPNVREALENVVLIKADITANDINNQELMKAYQVIAPPTFVFFNKKGKVVPKYRMVGEVSANALLKALAGLR